MGLSDYLYSRRVLRGRISALETELVRVQDAHREELERVREQAREDTAYARSLVESAMLRSGMYAASQIPPALTAPESSASPLISAYPLPEPLWLSAQRAREEEDAAWEKAQREAEAALSRTSPTEAQPS